MTHLSKKFLFYIFSFIFFGYSNAQVSCDADHRVLLTNRLFTPSNLTILPGETVAFINVEGTHNVNGVKNTKTGESFNNPVDFSLPQSVGTNEGVCMGVIKFDVPGVYNYDCSIGFNADLGMVGSINVDAFTIKDLMMGVKSTGEPYLEETFQSTYAMTYYLGRELDSTVDYTVFVPNQNAVDAIKEYMQLGQFDMLSFYDLKPALEYHIVEGVFMAKDLSDGQSLPTMYGQNVSITEEDGVLRVDGAAIISTDYKASNGVVHIIDQTLAPRGLPKASVWDIVEQSPDHNFFEEAIVNVGLRNTLRQQAELDPNGGKPGPFTLFAPTDDAVNALAQSLDMSIVEFMNSSFVDDLANQHIVAGRGEKEKFYDGLVVTNFAREDLTVGVTPTNTFTINGIDIIVTDLLAYNGVVHIIDAAIPIDIPNKSGTCGTWKLEMSDENGDGWNETNVYIYIDDELFSTQTLPFGSSSLFEFGVDSGSMVNIYTLSPNANTAGESYKIFDENNRQIAASGQNGRAVNSLGLLACAEPTDCGMIEVKLLDRIGEGWLQGYLEVYRNKSLYNTIQFFQGDEQSTFIPANFGDVFDFVATEGTFEPRFNSYVVYDADGNILVDQRSDAKFPDNVYNIIACEKDIDDDNNDTTSIVTYTTTTLFPNPVSDKLNITSDRDIQRIVITNLLGQKVYDEPFNPEPLDVSMLGIGSYIIMLETTEGPTFYKISVIR